MKVRLLGGILVLIAIAVIIWLLLRPPPPTITTVNGYLGRSKEGLMTDPDVQRILRDRYQLEAKFKTSSEVCGLPPGDFLWPGNDAAVEEYEECHGGVKATADSVLTSPLVFYSWDAVTDALVKQKLVEKRGDLYFANDMRRLMEIIVARQATWTSYGLPKEMTGKVMVIPADKESADSGHLFSALMANTLLGDVATPDTVGTVQPEINSYLESLGDLEVSSDALFRSYLQRGMGANPVIVAYESLLPAWIHTREVKCDLLKDKRIIYAEPTVWASHPMIAETDDGNRLLKALRNDAGIQQIAWERYGFRTWDGQSGITNTMCLVLPDKFLAVTRLPNAETMKKLKE